MRPTKQLLVKALLIVSAVAVGGQASVVQAVDCVGFSSIQSPTSTELARFNIKLTFLGEGQRLVPTVVLRQQGSPVDIRPAAFCRKVGNDYSRDHDPLVTCSVSAAQLKGALDSIGTVSGVTDGGLDSSVYVYVSVAVIDANGAASRVFDSLVDDSTAGVTLLKLRQALSVSDSASAILSETSCQLGLSPPEGTDVTDQVSVTLSGVRYRRSDNLYAMKMRIKNTSASSIAGPAVLAVRLYGAVVPQSPTGFLGCNSTMAGAPYYRILTTAATLAANGSVEFELLVSNPLKQEIKTLQLCVLRGVGG